MSIFPNLLPNGDIGIFFWITTPKNRYAMLHRALYISESDTILSSRLNSWIQQLLNIIMDDMLDDEFSFKHTCAVYSKLEPKREMGNPNWIFRGYRCPRHAPHSFMVTIPEIFTTIVKAGEPIMTKSDISKMVGKMTI